MAKDLDDLRPGQPGGGRGDDISRTGTDDVRGIASDEDDDFDEDDDEDDLDDVDDEEETDEV